MPAVDPRPVTSLSRTELQHLLIKQQAMDLTETGGELYTVIAKQRKKIQKFDPNVARSTAALQYDQLVSAWVLEYRQLMGFTAQTEEEES